MPYPLNIPDLSLFPHRVPAQIRFNDIDLLGHVNNTVYFSFYDTGKARFLEAVKRTDINFRKIETVIANVDCAFIRPIYFGQNIDILTRLIEVGGKHIKLQQMLVDHDTEVVHSLSESVMVYIDNETLRPINIPEHWLKRFAEYEANNNFEIH